MHVDGIRRVAASSPKWVDGSALGKRLWAIERDFYKDRGYTPAWIDGDRTTDQMKELVRHLHYAEAHGLDSSRYPVAEFGWNRVPLIRVQPVLEHSRKHPPGRDAAARRARSKIPSASPSTCSAISRSGPVRALRKRCTSAGSRR